MPAGVSNGTSTEIPYPGKSAERWNAILGDRPKTPNGIRNGSETDHMPDTENPEMFFSAFGIASANHVRLFHSRAYFSPVLRIAFRVVKDLGKSSSCFVKSL